MTKENIGDATSYPPSWRKCPDCEEWFPIDIILEMEEFEGNDPFWGEEEDLEEIPTKVTQDETRRRT